jgi:hypothetical protein
VLAALGSAGVWMLWRWGRAAADPADPKDAAAKESKGGGR